ncbi:MAG TPA: allantoinase AllB [Gemmatimonadota bacterium]|nr:allantoinase AllB [Gemmatimonadota bacterium]
MVYYAIVEGGARTRVDLVVRSRRVVLPDGVRPAAVLVADGRIAAVESSDLAVDAAEDVDLGDVALLPGGVDVHVHVNEPGRIEWEGFETATRAAAAAGVTTIVDMPLNSLPVTTTSAALEAKLQAAGDCDLAVDVAFWGGAVPGSAGEMPGLLGGGVLGAKAFLVDSGIPEFPASGEADLRAAMEALAALGAPLLAHAESPDALGPPPPPGTRDLAAWAASRPAEAEVRAVRLLVRLARETGAAVHVVHVSAAEVLPEIAAAKAGGLPVTAETCPHYLTFAAGEITEGDTRFKCAPPIRGSANRERLWAGLADGTIDLVASDHSPCPPEMKRLKEGDCALAWGGIAGLGVVRAATWTGAASRGFGLPDLARWTSAAPALLAGLHDRKGAIAPGLDADLVAWEPDFEWTVDPARLGHRWPVTAWDGRRLRGAALRTWVRGRTAWDGTGWTAPGRTVLGRARSTAGVR